MKTIMKYIALALVMISAASEMSANSHRFTTYASAPVKSAAKTTAQALHKAAETIQESVGDTVLEQTTEEMTQSWINGFKSAVATATSYVPSTDEVVCYFNENPEVRDAVVVSAGLAVVALMYVSYKKCFAKKS